MSKTTKNLGLFEYEKDKDGASTFNIEQALNGNWDKLDNEVAARVKTTELAAEVKKTVKGGGLTAPELGAEKAGAINAHNTSAAAHAALFKAINDVLAAHVKDTGNPHGVTAAQVGALPLTGGTLTGNLTGKYISGTWMQVTEDNHMKNTSAKVAVLDGSGWVYYRTVSELLADLNIPDSNAIRATTGAYGTTKLSNSVTSTSKTTAATPYAVKSALDTAKKYTDNSIKLAINSSY